MQYVRRIFSLTDETIRDLQKLAEQDAEVSLAVPNLSWTVRLLIRQETERRKRADSSVLSRKRPARIA